MSPITYASVCDGIGAIHVASAPLGWRCAWTAEIEPFPAAVVERHWRLPNLGDMTDITKERANEHGAIEILVGGTPCQSFSLAGLRAGLDDPRGNLALDYLRLAHALRPRWVVWENVTGVLSSNGGRDFGAFLGALGELGYGWSYRVLDAQYVRVDGLARAVPQRRRRVFVVGHLGGWAGAAAVLFDRESLCGDTPPRRQAGKGVARSLTASTGGCSAKEQQYSFVRGDGEPLNALMIVPTHTVASCLQARGAKGPDSHCRTSLVVHTLRAEGFDASEDGTGRGTGRGTPLVPVAFQTRIARNGRGQPEEVCPTLQGAGAGATSDMRPVIATAMAVRRLTPRECERLQGFPDDYTAIDYRGKPASDGPRYRALGNSMPVNVMRWLCRRIEMVEAIP